MSGNDISCIILLRKTPYITQLGTEDIMFLSEHLTHEMIYQGSRSHEH